VALHEAGKLDAAQVETFARDRLFDEAAIALAIMSDLPTGLIERALISDRAEQILVIAKAIGLTWDATREVLLLKSGSGGRSAEEIDQCAVTFSRLQGATAKQAIGFYRLRERAATTAAS
jgi:hypothetical protein